MEPTFSERMGFSRPRTIQVDAMDAALRNSIWNIFYSVFDYENWPILAERVAIGFLKVPAEQAPGSAHLARDWLSKHFGRLEWYRVYDLLEFVAMRSELLRKVGWTTGHFIDVSNAILQRELSAFRFVNGRLSRLTNEAEVRAVEEAATKAAAVGLDGVQIHLNQALALLGQRPEPDYRNSVKESISAVESAVKSITGVGGGGLDKALDALAKKAAINPALRAGLLNVYGYTSDADGIRHAILEQPTVDYDDAKFMLVACSAFTSFLIAKAEAAGLLKI